MFKGGEYMFLTKKSLKKVLLISTICFALGIVIIVLSAFLFSKILLVLGIIECLIGALSVALGCYAEGKGELLNLGNKLIREQLKPAEFIKEYYNVVNSNELIIKKPSIDVLMLLLQAYDCLDDRKNSLKTIDEMYAVAKEKKEPYINLAKAAILYSYGEKEEAERLFLKAQEHKLNAMGNLLVDTIFKSDRAIAIGDYDTARIQMHKMLNQKFPKLSNLDKLSFNYALGEIYEKQHQKDKAIVHYQYCANNGGETAIKQQAQEAVERLQESK